MIGFTIVEGLTGCTLTALLKIRYFEKGLSKTYKKLT